MNVSGGCILNKESGMVYIREDLTPSVLQFKSIDTNTSFEIALNSIKNLQATKDSSPKMIIKIIYNETKDSDEGDKDIRLTFTNKPTMNNIKECLQTIVSRQRITIESNQSTPTVKLGLSDDNLLKNHELQQKLLNEDKNLRSIFTQSVIHFKLSPTIFWSSRLNILRTYALTVNQDRGMYNVLSTIKPVATSDNKVHVNVTRNIIEEIFKTYPIVKKAFDDLVPVKFSEGEFWSRFFNSKLFRRLRGDKLNNSERGDTVLDQYLTIMANEANGNTTDKANEVVKLIDLNGNEQDNSVKYGNKPDFTMSYENNDNEVVTLLKNMNNLSSKMISNAEHETKGDEENVEIEEMHELELNDLNDFQHENFIDLKINFKTDFKSNEAINNDIKSFLKLNLVPNEGINLNDNNKDSINETAAIIINLIKLNFKKIKFKSKNSLPNAITQKFINLNITIVEFLSHFWKLFLYDNNPNQLKKIFTILKSCKTNLVELKKEAITAMNDDEILNDLNFYLSPILNSLDKALMEYVRAVKGVNENGKRPLEQ